MLVVTPKHGSVYGLQADAVSRTEAPEDLQKSSVNVGEPKNRGRWNDSIRILSCAVRV